MLQSLASFWRNRPRLGIVILALWALILTFLALVQTLPLTASVEIAGEAGRSAQNRVWIILALNLIFALIFGASIYGLWQQCNWGRLLFLWGIGTWSVLNILALFAPAFFLGTSSTQMFPTDWLVFNGLRHSIGLVLPLWYLNLPQIKMDFITEEPLE